MTYKWKIGGLTAAALALVAVFLFTDIGNWDYAFPRRVDKMIAVVLVGGAIALATVIFQTITNNRILTPSIIGLDSVYMLIQTGAIFLGGSMHLTIVNKHINFFVSLAGMTLFVLLLYKLLFKREGRNLYFLMLVGIVMGTLFGSMTTFMEVLIDPNEFQVVQGKMFASFNNIDSDLLAVSLLMAAAAVAYGWRLFKYLNVLSLGREHAVNLGIPYDYAVRRLLIVIAVLIAVSTALVGPITFLGLLVANVTYQFMNTYRHGILIPAAVLVSVIALVGGLLLVERVFTFSTTLSVIINFIGGVYFLYLLLRENKS
ncbi:iron chelate uptake ABC transporter family permease subunit [Paenibacillus thailandensis]|uniref:Iron chelate uptake ABC transporter family permease subunit n=1 Tax=Paenibacillus thailandensis TaxID=393250 RepID=A0ABW5R4R9_9BACL